MPQLGLIGNSALTNIANAIRTQNGGTALYKHSEMAAAVLALDGTQEGDALSKTASDGGGIVNDAYFSAIADAIRTQNGLSVTYTPAEMAPAILALEWDVGYKPRAALLANGTLEFNYLEKRRAVTSGKVVTAYEVSTEGYASASARPWESVKLTITKVVIDSSFTQAGCTNANYWFYAFEYMTELHGFENLAGVTSFTQAFVSCLELRSIYCDPSYDATGVTGSLIGEGVTGSMIAALQAADMEQGYPRPLSARCYNRLEGATCPPSTLGGFGVAPLQGNPPLTFYRGASALAGGRRG